MISTICGPAREPAGRGYDPITGQYLTGFERLVTLIGVLPILGVAGANLRYADEFIDTGDSLARYIGKASKTCSFDEETPVTTEDGVIAIKDVDVGDKVLAWDEATDTTGYFLVTTTYTDVHEVLVYLTIDGEQIETTPEHPFYTTDTGWTPAGELNEGDALRTIDGTTGIVDAVTFVATPRVMYNMTVADAHTYVVGDGEWVVHNACQLNTSLILFSQAKYTTSGRIDDVRRYQVADNVQWLIDNPGLDLPFGGPIEVFVKQPFMDTWGPLKHPTKDYVGDPVNLANGHIYTLDNRRLVTYILAMRDKIPVHWAYLDTIKAKRFEFDTPNFGIWIDPRIK